MSVPVSSDLSRKNSQVKKSETDKEDKNNRYSKSNSIVTV